TFQFGSRAFYHGEPNVLMQTAVVLAITASQALINHAGIRLTARLTDLSGYLILVVASLLTVALLLYGSSWDWARLVTFENNGGRGSVWPEASTPWLFVLGFLLPAYTITGF